MLRDDVRRSIARSAKGFEMADQERVSVSNTMRDVRPNIIETEGLTARYSTGCTTTGEWFALGTIVREGALKTMPAWVVVGTGGTVDEAVQNLTAEVGAQARNVARA